MTPLIVSVFLTAAPTFSPQALSDFNRAETALAAGRADDAVAAYQAAITREPTFARAMNGLGSALFKLNKKEEALEQFKKAIASDTSVELAHFNLGYCARKLSEYAIAVTAYEQYTVRAPKDADGFYGLGESYRHTGKLKESIAAFETFIKMSNETKWVAKAKATIADLTAELAQPAPAEMVAEAKPAVAEAPKTGVPSPAPAEAPAASTASAGEGKRVAASLKDET